jgi:hypothetical protein
VAFPCSWPIGTRQFQRSRQIQSNSVPLSSSSGNALSVSLSAYAKPSSPALPHVLANERSALTSGYLSLWLLTASARGSMVFWFRTRSRDTLITGLIWYRKCTLLPLLVALPFFWVTRGTRFCTSDTEIPARACINDLPGMIVIYKRLSAKPP